jgi:hypothetical protein
MLSQMFSSVYYIIVLSVSFSDPFFPHKVLNSCIMILLFAGFFKNINPHEQWRFAVIGLHPYSTHFYHQI